MYGPATAAAAASLTRGRRGAGAALGGRGGGGGDLCGSRTSRRRRRRPARTAPARMHVTQARPRRACPLILPSALTAAGRVKSRPRDRRLPPGAGSSGMRAAAVPGGPSEMARRRSAGCVCLCVCARGAYSARSRGAAGREGVARRCRIGHRDEATSEYIDIYPIIYPIIYLLYPITYPIIYQTISVVLKAVIAAALLNHDCSGIGIPGHTTRAPPCTRDPLSDRFSFDLANHYNQLLPSSGMGHLPPVG